MRVICGAMLFRPISAAVAALALSASASAPAATPGPAQVTVLGDSITAGYGLARAEAMPARLQAELARTGAPVTVIAAGVFGDTAEGGLARAGQVAPGGVVVVALGANDLLQGVAPARTEAALLGIVRRLKAKGCRVVLAGGRSPFAPAATFDALFARVARSEGVPLVPDLLSGLSLRAGYVQKDGLHPNARGAQLIAERLAPAVRAVL